MKRNLLEQAINFISPSWANKRMAARHLQQAFEQQMRGFDAAKKGRRRTQRKAPATSAPAEIERALTELRNAARELERNNPYAKNAIRKIANNTIGTGIIPTPKTDSNPVNKKIKKLWEAWAEETDCDYDGHLNFYGLQELVMRTVALSGECIVRQRIISDPSLPLPLQLQVLEGDFIDTTKHGPLQDGGYMYYGIEFNKQNKIVAYWLYDSHPGDSWRFNLTSSRYSADEIIHVFIKERPGQFRGVPMLHASMLRLEDLEEYEDAELVRQKIAACFTMFVQDPQGGTGVPLTGNDDEDRLERVEPGIIEYLPPGKTVQAFTPPTSQGYGEYTKQVLRGISAGVGMDYNTLTGDLTAVNFSSGRMGWLEFNRNVQSWQWNTFVPMFCKKSWKWFVVMAQVHGIVRAGAVVGASWSTPRREQINPEAETKALIDQVQNGLISWEDAVLESGYNPDEQIEKMKRNKEAFEKAGLPNYADKAAMSGKVEVPPQGKKPGDNSDDSQNK
jgi:lambda family phage portal protein